MRRRWCVHGSRGVSVCVRTVRTVVQRVDDDPGVLLAATEGTVVAIVHADACRIVDSASVRCY
jgi:hypothetical protein